MFKEKEKTTITSSGYTREINIRATGPFGWIGKKSIFNSSEDNALSGLYFFTVKIGKDYLIEYVGITKRSYLIRFEEHICEYLSGGYRICEPAGFSKGEHIALWQGRFGTKGEKDISKFLKKYNEVAPRIIEYLKTYSIFILPTKEPVDTLARIEGAIYEILKKSESEKAREFIEKEVRYKVRKPTEAPISIKINSDSFFVGLPNKFLA